MIVRVPAASLTVNVTGIVVLVWLTVTGTPLRRRDSARAWMLVSVGY